MNPVFARIRAAWLIFLATSLVACSAVPRPSKNEAPFWVLRTSDEIGLYVVEVGQTQDPGRTVIVLHGGPGAEHSYLLNAVRPLSDRYRFVLFDQRGSLRSPAPDRSVSFQRMVEDLEDLRKDLGLDRITILGHSAGAGLAYAYLAAHPDRVANLVLVGPVFPISPGAIPPSEALYAAIGLPHDPQSADDEQARYRKNQSDWEQRAAAQTKLEGLDHPPRSSKEAAEQWRINFAATNIFHIERWRQMEGGGVFYSEKVTQNLITNAGGPDKFSALLDPLYPALKAYRGGLTIIVGEYDFMDPGTKLWPAMTQTLGNARLDVIPEAGHSIWIDQPEMFDKAVARALEGAH